MSDAAREMLRTALRRPDGDTWTLDQLASLAHIRLVNMEHAWERLRDSPQATPDIKAVAEGFVGPRQ